MPSARTTAGLVAAAVVVGGGVAGVALSGGDDRTRVEAVAERGADVMPFSLDATTHVFHATPAGGIQRVLADDPNDRRQILLVRGHLREEARAFATGDFGDPAAIHGDSMPGLAELEEGHERIDVRYRDLAEGGQITYRTSDRRLAAAVRDWFDAQLRDHGPDARPGASDHAHTEHDG